jgi:ribose 5-phosphate isomerase A
MATQRCAESHGIPLTTLEEHPTLDLTIDGADEVDPDGNLIKGHGGALLREKIVASCSRRLLIVVDPSKLVTILGEKRALPVEIVDFGWSTHLDPLRALGAEPVLRLTTDGEPYRTDGGHVIIDALFAGGIAAPQRVEGMLRARPGVVETGLFLGFAPEIIVGDPEVA